MIDEALAALRDGKFILLYDFDDREGETDFAIRSDAVTHKHIVQMRKDGGGLICTAVHPIAAQRLGLPFASDALRAIAVAEREGDIPYDRKNHSSFSLWVNHRNTFTGITDRDRTLTVNAIAEQVKRALNGGNVNFHETFRTPGHMALLRAADGLLDVRKGQTELSIAMPPNLRKSPLIDMYEETRARGFGDEAKRRIMLGTYVLSSGYYDAYYLRAQKVRTLIKQDFDKVFSDCDVILSPTSPTTAFRIGEKINDPLAMYLSDIFTIPANMAGIPAISVPCGFDRAGLPIGLQLMAKPFAEETLLRAAYAYEQNTPWHLERAVL